MRIYRNEVIHMADNILAQISENEERIKKMEEILLKKKERKNIKLLFNIGTKKKKDYLILFLGLLAGFGILKISDLILLITKTNIPELWYYLLCATMGSIGMIITYYTTNYQEQKTILQTPT